jgi:hypothetical protein
MILGLIFTGNALAEMLAQLKVTLHGLLLAPLLVISLHITAEDVNLKQ